MFQVCFNIPVKQINIITDMFLIPDIASVILVGLLIVIPVGIIYKRAGFSPVWALLVFLPGFGLFLICLHLALSPWPNE